MINTDTCICTSSRHTSEAKSSKQLLLSSRNVVSTNTRKNHVYWHY